MNAADHHRRAVLTWPEKVLQQNVIELARLHGYLTYHTFDSRRSEPGFPDLVMARPGGPVLYRELKSEKGRASPAQNRWLHILTAADQDAAIWRPSDWLDGTIRRESAQEAHTPI